MLYVLDLLVKFLKNEDKTYAKVKDTKDNCVEVVSVSLLKKIKSVNISGVDNKGVKRIAEKELLDTQKTLLQIQNNTDFVYDADIPTKLIKCISQADVIEIPYGITAIGARAFQDLPCKQIILPDTITEIGNDAFRECRSLSDINIPPKVLYIESSTFSDCDALEKITIPEGVIAIEDSAFYSCNSLKEVVLPQFSLKAISSSVFAYCSSLTTIVLPMSLEHLGECVRKNSSSFSYSRGATFRHSGIESIRIPPKIKGLEQRTFAACPNLKQVVLSEGLTYIGESVFSECKSLESINIPTTITKINQSAFSYCSSLKTLNLPDVEYEIGGQLFASSGLETIKLPSKFFVKTGTSRPYFSASGSTVDMFARCYCLKSIDLPVPMRCWIGEHMFRECTQLKELHIPNGVVGIDNEAFLDCSALEVVTIPASVTRLGKKIFEGCTNLKKIRCYKDTAGAKRAKGLRAANKAIEIEYI